MSPGPAQSSCSGFPALNERSGVGRPPDRVRGETRDAATPSLRRVLLGIGSSGPGGAEQMVLRLAEGLRVLGLDPVVASMRPGWMTARAEQAGFPVWIAPQRKGPDPLWVVRFARRLRREGVELLHTHEFDMNVYGGVAAALARVPHLATFHGRVWGLERARDVAAYRLVRALGSQLQAVSRDLAGFVAARLRLAPEEVPVIHNGIPIRPRLTPDRRETVRAGVRAELGLPAEAPLLLAVGNLYPVKDHATALRALDRLPGVHLAIAGRGKEEDPLRRLAAELGIAERVHLLGLRDDIQRLLDAADAFVHPSRSEGLPLAILEGMEAALPVVATRVGGIPEAVIEGGTGHLVPPGDPKALAEAISRLLEAADRGAALGGAGRARAEEEFSVERMTDRHLRLYATMARR